MIWALSRPPPEAKRTCWKATHGAAARGANATRAIEGVEMERTEWRDAPETSVRAAVRSMVGEEGSGIKLKMGGWNILSLTGKQRDRGGVYRRIAAVEVTGVADFSLIRVC